jgi:chemotaxis protein methyltransferase WspC
MSRTAILELLQQRLGFSPDAIGPTAIDIAVGHRMRVAGRDDIAGYAHWLAEDRDEFEALVDEVVVPETWFFRGGDLFAYVARHVKDRRQPVRILSVPCSTGEEPYSLAIALHDAGVLPHLWTLTAVDVSHRHLERARLGRYGPFAFRQTDDEPRRRHFQPVNGGWQVSPAHRSAVTFQHGNLIDPLFLTGQPLFDVVFCRNLLIYLHSGARRQVLANLERLLTVDGLLAVGHAEPQILGPNAWRRVGGDQLFLFRRLPVSMDQGAAEQQGRAKTVNPVNPKSPRGLTPSVCPNQLPPARPSEDLLVQARQHADAGRLANALASCRAHLAAHGPSADLCSLQGTIHQARHETTEARQCFERALYLQPDHPEALLHLMLLARQQGDQERASLLRTRLERATEEDA